MMYATKEQITKIHVLLSQLRLMNQKKELVANFSSGRTESTKELTIHEARELIQALAQHDPCDKMRRAVFALAYEAGIIWGESLEDKKMNVIKLNQFLLNRGAVKKEVGQLTYNELVKVVTQLQKIVRKSDEQQAAKATASLLEELNLETSYKKHSKSI